MTNEIYFCRELFQIFINIELLQREKNSPVFLISEENREFIMKHIQGCEICKREFLSIAKTINPFAVISSITKLKG